ncbi:MAG: FadR family transcriptional regulator [Actinobacteria bacterium]|nr:FadR family transcriptional regulator [Actinomycetota bacterium]
MMRPTDQAGGFGQPVTRGPRLSDRVAELMLDTILSRQLQPGDPLPSERELGDQFGVSRTVIREAVRSLSAKGVVSSLPGRGLVVAALDPEDVSSSMSLYLRGQAGGIPYERIHEVRSALEVDLIGRAAERASEEDLEKLREAHERMGSTLDDLEGASQADVAFHRALAESTDNVLYLIMLDSIGDVLLDIRRRTLGLPDDAPRGHKEHAAILAAVEAHDAERAREAMRAHLASALERWHTLEPAADGGG